LTFGTTVKEKDGVRNWVVQVGGLCRSPQVRLLWAIAVVSLAMSSSSSRGGEVWLKPAVRRRPLHDDSDFNWLRNWKYGGHQEMRVIKGNIKDQKTAELLLCIGRNRGRRQRKLETLAIDFDS
jgi:hypothetical protein